MPFGQREYRQFALPALGVLETILTKGRSPGKMAMGQEQIFRDFEESDRAAQKAALEKQVTEADLEDANAKRLTAKEQKAREETLRRMLGSPAEEEAYYAAYPEKLGEKYKPQSNIYIPTESGLYVGNKTGSPTATPLTDPNKPGTVLKPPAKPDQRDRYAIKVIGNRQVKVNLDTGEQVDLGEAPSKPANIQNVKNKLQTIKILRSQIANLRNAQRNLKPVDFGLMAGRQSVTQSARLFDKALAPLQSTVRSLTRTPGEGSMSDFEGRLALAQIPNRIGSSEEIEQSIRQLEDLATTIEEGYSQMAPQEAPQDADPMGLGL